MKIEQTVFNFFNFESFFKAEHRQVFTRIDKDDTVDSKKKKFQKSK